jgi:hypothetical protein
VLAIDVLLEPDTAMVGRATAVNARLRASDPSGFAFDATHAPHVTLTQRFVRADALGDVVAAVERAVRAGPPLPLALATTARIAGRWAGGGVLLDIVGLTPELRRLEAAIGAAAAPFAGRGGTADAFVKDPGESIRVETIAYVEDFVPAASGPKYQPHLTLGAAPLDVVRALATEPFEPFAFAAPRVAIYQLGDFGTARRRLWTSGS